MRSRCVVLDCAEGRRAGADGSQARIAEEAGACAVMALERVPADIRREGGVARMASTPSPHRAAS